MQHRKKMKKKGFMDKMKEKLGGEPKGLQRNWYKNNDDEESK